MNNLQIRTLKFLTVSTLPLLATTALVAPSSANSFDVACKTDASNPTIVASVQEESATKEATILQFLPQYFSSEDAISNCQNTATKLQELYQTNSVNYLASDTLNDGQSVICAVERRGNGCSSYSSEILFTLAKGTDPSSALYDMLDNTIKESYPRPDSRTVSRIYTDINPSIWSAAPKLRWWSF